ncbi:MAG: molybdopterin-dependent oxidoreductase [Anaerolineaceae bacterium]|nr:molybdopterin-dependent oxidoreductase [Anaerolineaceae bacterium]
MKTNRTTLIIVSLVVLLSLILAACGTAATTAAPVATEVATESATEVVTEAPATAAPLVITGMVGKELSLSDADLHGLKVENLSAEHPKKGKMDYTGVRMSELLAKAEVKPEAKTLTFISSDGFTAEIDLATLNACADCMLAFSDTPGDYSAVMPGQSSKLWAKAVVKIEIK